MQRYNAALVEGFVHPVHNSLLHEIARQTFSDQTGGTAYLPSFQSVSLKNNLQNTYNLKFNQETLTRIFRQLANELQAQYLVQYYSDGNFPVDKYVKLDVGLQNQQRFKVRARQGYFVKN